MAAPQRHYAVHAAMLATVFVWGATFVLIKDALQDVSPLLFNLLRMSLAFALLAAIHHRSLRNITRAAWISSTAAGICLAIGYQFQTAGLRLTTPSKSAFLTGLVVVLVPILALIKPLRAPHARRPSTIALLAALPAFIGVVLLTTTSTAGAFHSINTGDLLTLACALGFALHVVALAHASPRIPLAQLTTLQIGVAAAIMLITTPLLERSHILWTPRVLIALSATALLATAAAFTVQTWAQRHLPPSHTALLLALEPVFAWLTAMVILHDHLTARALAGAALILSGILLAELKGNATPPPAPVSASL